MSAFGGKADATACGNSLLRSLLGLKRTCPLSAYDPASSRRDAVASYTLTPIHCVMPSDADRTADYKGFTIRTFKAPDGLWRAIITKADGSKLKAAGQNESFDLIPFQLDSLDRDEAVKEAKRLIDAGGVT